MILASKPTDKLTENFYKGKKRRKEKAAIAATRLHKGSEKSPDP